MMKKGWGSCRRYYTENEKMKIIEDYKSCNNKRDCFNCCAKEYCSLLESFKEEIIDTISRI